MIYVTYILISIFNTIAELHAMTNIILGTYLYNLHKLYALYY